MSNRTDAQAGIDAQVAKQDTPDTITPANQANTTLQPMLDGAVMSDELPYTLTPELVKFDRDIQVPQNSINIGDAIKMSDLAQSIGYQTAFDKKQYVLMSYEIGEDGSKNPIIKDFDSPSEFVLQSGFDTTQTFAGLASFPITSQQNVIGQTYNLKLFSEADVELKVIRVGENGGENTVIVSEILPASSTSLDGFDFDLTPLTDFQNGIEYLMEFSTPNGEDIKVMGVNVHATFKPYIKRAKGWEYTSKEIAFVGDNANAYASSNDIPKLYAHKGVVSDAPFKTTSNVAQLVDTWELNVSEAGLYNVFATVEWKLNATNQDAVFRFDLNGVTGIELNQEPKDSTNKVFLSTFVFDTLQAGQNTIKFYARKESEGTNTLTISSNRCTAQKIDELS